MSDPNRPERTAPGRRPLLKGIAGFLGASVLAGVLVAVSVTPAIAVTGSMANNGIALFENLPSYLKIDDLPQKSNMYATGADGAPVLLASFYQDNREMVEWDQISQFAKDAAVAGEDVRFYEHGGVDVTGTVRALVATATGADVQGGSSITQQYVKNVLVNNGVSEATTDEEKQAAYEEATEVSVDRKLKEMRYAIALEKEYSKDQILQGYLNIAHFGGITYGIQAAAEYYYGIDNSQLSIAQAASIIAITQSPNTLRLDRPDSETNGAANGYALNKERRDYIIDSMLAQGMIDQAQHDEAINTVIEPHITPSTNGCQTAGTDGSSGFYCDYVTKIIENEMDDPETPDVNEGTDLLTRGGLDIYTTLDLDVQAETVSAINDNVPQHSDAFDVGSASVSVEAGTGRVLAMAQNKKYSQDPSVTSADPTYTAVNYSTDYAYGGSTGFQPGSTYKVFTLAEWLNEGHSLYENFDGSVRPITVSSCEGTGGTWTGGNDDSTTANNALNATKYSVNSSFLSMASEMDLCDIKTTAQSFGMHRADGNDLTMYPADVLGTQEIAPLTMAAAYAGIANDGVVCTPVAIDRIVKSDGSELEAPKTTCDAAVEPDVAHAMQYAMESTFDGGTAAASDPGTGIAHIGKTGTTDNAVSTWMDGASSKVSTVVWVGNVQGTASMRQQWFDSGAASTARHRIWPRIMSVIDGKYGGDEFTDPDQTMLQGRQVAVPDVTGLTIDAATKALTDAGFTLQDGGAVDSDQPAGQIVSYDPSGQATAGATITVRTSNGSAAASVPDVVGSTVREARRTLEAAGFTVQVSGDAESDWVVTAQSPSGGSGASAGSTVALQASEPDDAPATTEPTPAPGDGGDRTGG
ncbi:transglycosylase domain-containing protein [Agromyces seonyuensis]|uniref:PASTA domain-containing protein n=1 Tax=Agromyces seonyuensis TaxID=2662446 RepID=A0A6I4NWS3_9MICO|nr:transglycosylase domain-containing protein [Agromyces seonyuensis]MWB98730.1 PASTA domain-containing protein [Agromyces seonyuensis]